MSYWVFIFLAIALLGHAAFWVAVNNRLHATALPYRFISLTEKVIAVVVVLVPLAFTAWLWQGVENDPAWMVERLADLGPWLLYFGPAALVSLVIVPAWLQRQFFPAPVPAFVSNHTERINVARALGRRPVGNWTTRLMVSLPGNEVLSLAVHEKTLALAEWPAALDGLSLVHLSDLHFTGGITREYFDVVIERANALEADLVAITGDVIDAPACVPWIAETLGRLQSRCGVFAILGNHDKRKVEAQTVRTALANCGIHCLGGSWRQISVNGTALVLAGNELPWFGPAPNLADAPPPLGAGGAPRVLLSHTPDQIRWAEAHAFDLMLAGHTHGGQIRFPLLGPVVAPSRYGVRFASGVFQEGRTLLHVSRGVSGKEPLRWNCPPELTKLVLRRPGSR